MENTHKKPLGKGKFFTEPIEGYKYLVKFPSCNVYFDAENLEELSYQLFEYIDLRGEDPKSIITPADEYGEIPFRITLFHYCYAKGVITEDELIEMLKLEV